MSYKYYMADFEKLADGDSGPSVGFNFAKQQVSRDDFDKHIADFYAKSDAPDEKKEESRTKLYQYLESGKEVTVGNKTLSIKKK